MRLSIIKPKNPSRSLRTNQGGLNELCCITGNLQPKFFATVAVGVVLSQISMRRARDLELNSRDFLTDVLVFEFCRISLAQRGTNPVERRDRSAGVEEFSIHVLL